MDGIDDYLQKIQLLEEVSFLNEDVSSFIKKITPIKVSGILSKLKTSIFKKDIKLLGRAISSVPTVSIDIAKKLGKKTSPDFDKSFRFASDYLKRKHFDIPEGEPLEFMACMVAVISSSAKKGGDIIENTKEVLLKFDDFIKKNKSRFIKEQGESLGGGVALFVGGVLAIIGLFTTTLSTVVIGLILVILGSFVIKMMS